MKPPPGSTPTSLGWDKRFSLCLMAFQLNAAFGFQEGFGIPELIRYFPFGYASFWYLNEILTLAL
jgi:hypothetical protein